MRNEARRSNCGRGSFASRQAHAKRPVATRLGHALMSGPIRLELSNAEAFVLFEWLAREDQRKSIHVEHHAEEIVLWRIEAQLEKALVEPFKPNYSALLDAARTKGVESE